MSAISKITLPNGTTYNITDGRGMFVGRCSSSAASRIKEIVINSDQDFVLKTGAVIAVQFIYTNTCISSSSAPVFFNVNGTGNVSVDYGTEYPAIGDNPIAYGTAGCYHYYVYNTVGAWVWIGYNKELDTTYAGMTNSEIIQGTSTTDELISPANLKLGVQTWETPTDQYPVKNSTNSVSSGYAYDMSKSLINQINNGAKNRLPFSDITVIKAQNTGGTWSGNTYTWNGVTFTINNDFSITANGKATGSNAVLVLSRPGGLTMPQGDWVLSGCPSGGSTSTYNISIAGTASDTGTTASFTSCNSVLVRIFVLNGASISNAVFRPMICSKEDWNMSQLYAPYCPTLQELYQMILNLQSQS